jgi:hypothetical protein
MSSAQILYVVHCIDTEGPLKEDLAATFSRLKNIFKIELEPTIENLRKLQNRELDLGSDTDAIADLLAPELLRYNEDWNSIDLMLEEILSQDFRQKMLDDSGLGWVYSWHCMDHVGFSENPRHKDYGYGSIYRHYRKKLDDSMSIRDELNWHFHPYSITRHPLHAATSYANSYHELIQILCRRILDEHWFPVVNRPGFHSERPDSHFFLEQWIPFDYANQFTEEETNQPDLTGGRFGDWTRAPKSWRGYHPSHDDYQREGSCNRTIFRCLNLGTRLRTLKEENVREAFDEAEKYGRAVLAFADHDWRDLRPDISKLQEMLCKVKVEYPNVQIRFSGAEEAAVAVSGFEGNRTPVIQMELVENRLEVEVVDGEIFGPQPFLAIKSKDGNYYHDNLDVQIHRKKWIYIFDELTLHLDSIKTIAVGSAGKYGKYCVVSLDL